MSGNVILVTVSVRECVLSVRECVLSVGKCVFSVRECVFEWYGAFVRRDLSEMWFPNERTRFFTARFVLY